MLASVSIVLPGDSSPLIVGDVQMPVDGEEGLLEEADPLPLLLLRLLENGLHLLHVAWGVGRHILQHLLIVLSTLQTAHRDIFMRKSIRTHTNRVSHMAHCLKSINLLFTVPMLGSVNTELSNKNIISIQGKCLEQKFKAGARV